MKEKLFYVLFLALLFGTSFSLCKSVKANAYMDDDIVLIDEVEDEKIINNKNEENAETLDLPALGSGENHDGNGNDGILGENPNIKDINK